VLKPDQITHFQETVWDYYHAHKRGMPWRDNPTPYNVLVSEIMLQQTQVPRVIPKFAEFMARFPDIKMLATAPLADVMAHWSGLGYNRRAKFLHEAAKMVVQQYGGALPGNYNDLVLLPGIGPNTAGAILAYAFEQPVVFIETNIRTVVICHFFADADDPITDAQIKDIMQQTIPADTPREWYWALMDYGTHLKATVGGQLQRVHGYKKQSKFQGSRRQIRGEVLKALISGGNTTMQLRTLITDDRLAGVLQDLRKEGLVALTADIWHLTGHDR
jgi:A/G-specific adenine glycosylase